MAVESHINSLKSRHQQLESQLEEMLASPAVETNEINNIKRQKLVLKDRIEELVRTSRLN